MSVFMIIFFTAIVLTGVALLISGIMIFAAWYACVDDTLLERWYEKMFEIGENLAKRGGQKS